LLTADIGAEDTEHFRIAVDNCKSEKAACFAGQSAGIEGRVLLVCIHADGTVDNLGNATVIDDWTDDFDFPGDYDAFMERWTAR
jgi:hypothetical protein